ncbi:MAG: hypothetical protein AAF149_22290 [Bacteroidota bacterium]
MKISPLGNVGIGTSNSSSTLHILSSSTTGVFDNSSNGRKIEINPGSGVIEMTNGSLHLNRSASGNITFAGGGGQVAIGTFTPDAKLTVKDDVHAKEVRVDLSVPGPGYVFEQDYDLPSLESIQGYFQENKYLAEVPSAKEMEENGIDLDVMNMLLFKKVEELTLHLIEQEKSIVELETKNN